MAVVDNHGKRHIADIWCKVLDTGLKIIVGLPDLLDHFLEGFIDILRIGAASRASLRYREKEKTVKVSVDEMNFTVMGFKSAHEYRKYLNEELLLTMDIKDDWLDSDNADGALDLSEKEHKANGLVQAWRTGLVEAPEEKELPTPVQFEDAQAYLSGTGMRLSINTLRPLTSMSRLI